MIRVILAMIRVMLAMIRVILAAVRVMEREDNTRARVRGMVRREIRFSPPPQAVHALHAYQLHLHGRIGLSHLTLTLTLTITLTLVITPTRTPVAG